MSVNPGPPGKGAKRLSPDELAQEVAKPPEDRRAAVTAERPRRFDIVTVSRIVMALTVVLFGVGVAVAVPWIGGLVGYRDTGHGQPGRPGLRLPWRDRDR